MMRGNKGRSGFACDLNFHEVGSSHTFNLRTRLHECPKRVADCVIISVTADEDADRGRVGVSSEPVIDEGDVEGEFAGMLGLELSGLQLDNDVPELLNVKEQQVEVEVIADDVEVVLAAHECEPLSQLTERIDDAVHEGLFQVAFGCVLGQFQEIEHVGVFGDLPGQVGISGC